MWWNKSQTSVVPREELQLVSTLVKPELPGDEFEAYVQAAEAVGLQDSPAIKEERLRRALAEENIRVYDTEAVYRYLHEHLENWHWAAVAEHDAQVINGMYSQARAKNGWWAYMRSGPYTEKIPLPVLLTIKKIREKVPESYFFISSQRAAGDPFLMVIAVLGTTFFIIERWDEPSFRES